MYSESNDSEQKHVTIANLNKTLKEKELASISNSSLQRVLPTIGFKYKKDGNRRFLVEQSSIALLRTKFLRSYNDYEDREKIRTFGYPCDLCNRVICEKCNSLQAQEIRVIPSSNRTLVYTCPECKPLFKESLQAFKQIQSLQQEISLHKKEISNLKARVKNTENELQLKANKADMDKDRAAEKR
ncbi:unnamed protein product [Acanthoscelides obtectus]|uniref:Uncharacterized protein n=1 Tax=Acanthoscelides obtectus TaxID=200917 RepID=A0A9P0M7Q6_ACAOB|nr:unnamed protein product [Acanthoscelides obtectus]CAK1641143.1 hypothetical protein AOBTE_LOCUS12190 [Acanthoscelides obtectus]